MLFNRKGKFFLNLDGNADRANSDSPEAAPQDSDQLSEQTKAPESAVAESAVAETAVAESAVTETAVTETTVTETAVAEKTASATAVAEAAISSPNSPEQQDNRPDSVVAETVKPVATLESITNDLAIAEAQRPALSYTTFAPDNLVPGSGLRPRTRRPGAALKDFRGIAQDLFKS